MASSFAGLGAEEQIQDRTRGRLRALRTQRGLTLAQVAERAHLDVSTLSRLETGQRRLALDHLPPLAAALGVSIDELVGAPPLEDPRVQTRPRHHDGMTIWPLTRAGGLGGPRAFKLELDSRRRTPPDELPVHEGTDWLYVLKGPMRLVLGERDLRIAEGEAVQFSTLTPHWFGTIEGPVELILIVGPQGEELHLER
jgi:transcriptional regulator with XRE-family HTH domain